MMFIIARHSDARPYFRIERPKLGMELSYEFRNEKRTGPNIDTKDTRGEFKERMAIETRGWVYHPALCQYTLSFEPEWRQIKEEHSPDKVRQSQAYSPIYMIDTTFLKQKPYTLHLFGHRQETGTSSDFAARSDTRTDTYGGDLSLKSRFLPTTLSYSHLTGSQTGFFTSEEESNNYKVTMRHSKNKSETRLKSAYIDKTRISHGITTRTKTSNSDIRNRYNITEDKRIWLNSFLTYRRTKNDQLTTSGMNLSENLFVKHRENLRSDYTLTYDTNKTGDFENKKKSLNAVLTHLLYENLTTSVAGHTSFSKSTGGKENIYGTTLDFDYRRKIPWGTLNLNLGYDYEITSRSFNENFIQAGDEPHILKTGDFTLLDNENIDIGTIRVTDITGATVYIRDIDYTLKKIDTFVRISRTTFGSIAEGQQVMVGYVYLANPNYDDAVFGQSYGISFYFWDALNISYRFRCADQDILSGVPPERIIKDTVHSAQMRLDWRWTQTKFSYNNTDSSSGISTQSWHAEETLTFRPYREIYFSFSSRYGKRNFKETGESEKLYGISSNVDWLPFRWCKLSFVSSKNIVSGDLVKTTDTNAYATLELFYRIWSGRIRYDFLDQKDDINEDQRTKHMVIFEIIRRLW